MSDCLILANYLIGSNASYHSMYTTSIVPAINIIKDDGVGLLIRFKNRANAPKSDIE